MSTLQVERKQLISSHLCVRHLSYPPTAVRARSTVLYKIKTTSRYQCSSMSTSTVLNTAIVIVVVTPYIMQSCLKKLKKIK